MARDRTLLFMFVRACLLTGRRHLQPLPSFLLVQCLQQGMSSMAFGDPPRDQQRGCHQPSLSGLSAALGPGLNSQAWHTTVFSSFPILLHLQLHPKCGLLAIVPKACHFNLWFSVTYSSCLELHFSLCLAHSPAAHAHSWAASLHCSGIWCAPLFQGSRAVVSSPIHMFSSLN